MKDVLREITMIRLERGWSEYELAKNSGISQSTISTWYRKNQTPTIQTLDKVCKGFGITLSQFFAEGDDSIFLTQEQKETLDNWSALNQKQRQLVTELLKIYVCAQLGALISNLLYMTCFYCIIYLKKTLVGQDV